MWKILQDQSPQRQDLEIEMALQFDYNNPEHEQILKNIIKAMKKKKNG